LNEVLLTVSLAVIRVVSYVKNSPFIGKLFAKLRDDMAAEHTALLTYCETKVALTFPHV